MPYTKRKAIHDGQKGLASLINYCKDEKKTDGGMLMSGVNCNINFAEQEFMANTEKYHKENDERIAYHAIQSFDYRDDIAPELVNEIGVKLCKELYPDFQCAVFTHIDKGHLHNHIIVNATNLKGRKLEDRLANQKEGLYALRSASDQLGLEYGCHVMKEFKPIGRYKSKQYEGEDKKRLYEVATASWKSVITAKIDELKDECQSFDELLERLALEGYIIKRGKHIGVKPYGKERFANLYKLGEGYSENDLKKFFKEKTKVQSMNLKKYSIVNKGSEIINHLDDTAKKSKEAIELSSLSLKPKRQYPKYFNSRYKEIKRYNELVKTIDFMNTQSIYNNADLMKKISELKEEIIQKEFEYGKIKSLNNEMQANVPFAKIYIENYTAYKTYEEQRMMFGEDKVRLTNEAELFISAKNQLNNVALEEVREFLSESGRVKRDANRQYAYISYLRNQLAELDSLRTKTLVNEGYIKGMSFSNDMIDYDRTTEEQFCVRLPYTQYFVYLPAISVAWDVYGKRATMYLVDDEKYEIYNQENEKIDEIAGEDLEVLSKSGKEELKEFYNRG